MMKLVLFNVLVANSAQNTTWDSTVGWILGFREFTAYDLSVYYDETTSVAIITGDTGASTSLYNYFNLFGRL